MYVALAVGFAAGCTSSQPLNSVERAQPTAHPNAVEYRQVITDSDISGIAEVLGVNQSTVGDLLKVQVSVFNGTSAEGTFDYKFEWYDSNGILLDTPTSIWRPQTIEANEEVLLVAVSPTPDAKDFKLKLQASQ